MHSAGGKLERPTAITVRPASASDARLLHAVLKESPEAAVWPEEGLRETISRGIAWAAEVDGDVAGFLLGRLAADEFEILNLAVRKVLRRKGIATRLLNCAVEHARAAGARNVFLEVRASNAGAIAFYSRMRFLQCGCRPKYYRDPVEDAVVLVLHIGAKTS